jgi:hypothetical protein
MRIALILLLLVTASCVGSDAQTSTEAGQSSSPAAMPATNFTTADFKKVRWIEGTWRGTGVGQGPFYERYKFENETTLAVETLEGEKLDQVSDVTRFTLKDGRITGGGEGSVYAASAIDNNSITFDPIVKARNSFTWKRENENSWTAILAWSATDKKPAGQRTYQMERWPKQ